MNFNKSCKILELNKANVNKETIRKAYFKKALKYHPDKNHSAESNKIFIEIQEAYNYLNENENEYENVNVDHFLSQYVFTILKSDSINYFTDNLKDLCDDLTIKILYELELEDCLSIINLIENNKMILNISNKYMERLKEIKKNKSKDKKYIILNPLLENLVNKDIYLLTLDLKEPYCIPLWHNQLEFDDSVIVKIEPILSDNIEIKNNNDLVITERVNIKDILNKKYHEIKFLKNILKINVEDIRLKTQQIIKIKKAGIPIINTKDIFCVENISDVYINLQLFI